MADFKCEVRNAIEEDCESLMKLIQELAINQKVEHRLFIDIETLRNNGFGDRPLFRCLVAEYEQGLIGFVLYNFMFSAWYGRTAFMEDFYVKEEYRKLGIGTRLLKSAIQDSVESGCNMMQWLVFKWNNEAVNYYKKLGAINLTENENIHVMRFLEDALLKLSDK